MAEHNEADLPAYYSAVKLMAKFYQNKFGVINFSQISPASLEGEKSTIKLSYRRGACSAAKGTREPQIFAVQTHSPSRRPR